MASLSELARSIETTNLADSKVDQLKGKNVRGPSLIPGEFYIAKTWKPTVENSDNVFFAVRFTASVALTEDGERQKYEDNPRLIDMKPEDRYVFERNIKGKNTEMLAWRHDDCLCFGDNNVRLTFYSVVNSDPNKVETKTDKKAAAPKTARKQSRKTAAKKDDKAVKEPEKEIVVATEDESEVENDVVETPIDPTMPVHGEEVLQDERPEAEAELERREDAEGEEGQSSELENQQR